MKSSRTKRRTLKRQREIDQENIDVGKRMNIEQEIVHADQAVSSTQENPNEIEFYIENFTSSDEDENGRKIDSDLDEYFEENPVADILSDGEEEILDDRDYIFEKLDVEEDPALYEGADITKWESILSILNFVYRHKTSKVLLSNLLKLISLHIPSPNLFPNTNYKFFKNFEDVYANLRRHYYCSYCLVPVKDNTAACDCTEHPKSSYFISISLQDQLQALYDRPGFFDLLNNRFKKEKTEEYSDICDGRIYKEVSTDGKVLNDPNNITLEWFTDGFKVHKTKYEVWSFYNTINELPYSERMKIQNLLLPILWFAECKPNFEYVLKVLYDDLQVLASGVDFNVYGKDEPVHVKVLTICGTCDSPAKAMVLNMTQYNGKYGCQTCNHPGETAEGTKNVRVFDCNIPFELRTEEEHAKDVEKVRQFGGPVNGVKGPTLMSKIAYKFLQTTVVDPLHCVFEGSVKKILFLWLSESKSEFKFLKSSAMRQLIDKCQLFLKPPSHVQRLPRSTQQHLAQWKGHEYKNWLFYYSLPILCDLLPENEFEMIKLLVHGVALLWQDRISESDIELADRTLQEFVKRFQDIFGLRHVTSCIHLHLHLTKNVKDFGSLPITSCFPYEDINGKLKNFVTGTNSPHLQICQALSAFKVMETWNDEKLRNNRPAQKYVDSIQYKVGRLNRRQINKTTHIIGKCTLVSDEELENDLMNNRIAVTRIFEFQRLLKHKFLYVSKSYVRPRRTCNFCITYKTFCDEEIGVVECFIRVQNCNCNELCVCEANHFAVVKKCTVRPAFQSPISNKMIFHMFLLTGIDDVNILVNVENIVSINFAIQIIDSRKTFIAKVINSMEFE